MSRTKNVSRNIIWGLLNKASSLGLPFISRTVMIYTLGMNYVGLGSLFSSILSVLSFAELGIGSALVFSMYKPIEFGDDNKVSALLNLYRRAYRTIGAIILFAGLLIAPFLHLFVASDVPEDINLQVLFFLYLINNLIGYFLYAYKQALFVASQRVDKISKVQLVLNTIASLSQIVILLTIRNYYVYVIVLPIITLLNNLIISWLADKSFPQYKCTGRVSKLEIKEIEKKIGGMLFQKIGSIILTSADTLVISAYLGLNILGVYTGYYYVINALFGISSVLQQAVIPSVGNSIITDSSDKNLCDFKKINFLYHWFSIWCCASLLGIYQPFIRLWQGEENMFSDGTVILFVIYFFVYKMGDVSWIYREALGFWWEARFIPFTSSVVNLVINIILVQYIGLPGVLISTIIALTLVNFPWSSRVLFLSYFRSKIEWIIYMRSTFFYFLSMLVVSIITYVICMCVPEDGFVNLIVRVFICIIIPNVILVAISLNNPEFKSAGIFILRIMPSKIIPRFVEKYFI